MGESRLASIDCSTKVVRPTPECDFGSDDTCTIYLSLDIDIETF
jgi:hypothetical protein